MIPSSTPSVPVSSAIYRDSNTKRASALLTVGVDFASDRDNERTTNIYSEKAPYRPGMPGTVTYLLKDKSLAGQTTQALADTYDDSTFSAAVELDAIVDEICAAAPDLGARLRNILPHAIVSYLRGGFENRERILDLWKKALPMILVRRSETSFSLVHRNAPEHILKKFGIK